MEGIWDVNVADYPRMSGEEGDSARIMRAFEAAGPGGVVLFPRGEYAIDSTVDVPDGVSLLLHKSAKLRAVREMDFVLSCFGGQLDGSRKFREGEEDHNIFVKGGEIDGNGLASCAIMGGFRHFTIADMTFRNGKKTGLQLGDPDMDLNKAGGYEVIANNLYFACNLSGLAGNTGFLTYIGDSHFTDIVVVDYTVGICDRKWSNRFTRCHVWGGRVNKAGTEPGVRNPEMLENSIAFDLHGADSVLEDCYADTAMIGYNVCGDARIIASAFYNNWTFGMDNPVVFNHEWGELLVYGGRFSKNSPNSTLYRRGENAGLLHWNDNKIINFTEEELADLTAELAVSGKSALSDKDDTKLSN